MTFSERYGPWALVTGASDGIGLAMAHRLAALGVNLVLVARREAVLRTLAAELTAAHHVETLVISADLVQPGAADHVVTATAGLDVGSIVLAAGFGSTGAFAEARLTDELEMIAVKVGAVAQLTHLLGARLIERGRGGIVLFGSIVGWQGVSGQATYAATKAFVQSFAEGIHPEYAAHGVDVLCVAPGPVDTGFGDRAGLAWAAQPRPTRSPAVRCVPSGARPPSSPEPAASS
ncbi:short-chain dehydrogenase [Mycobacterium antarcticum]|uniref:SDR family NAD(P)-dependent oxidoreductase n=1 Tax=Mycolicibacterium sp. TUM20983 TaxID=3023369 RepID=UPI002388F8DC|nr:SDR family NAD(P)-dependent oxidoreductase [Mycolicibacterium sp. TUM20983]GLP72920.1 short-chain dehydrogenase [Mycolicibacterium sp. TUM20983]